MSLASLTARILDNVLLGIRLGWKPVQFLRIIEKMHGIIKWRYVITNKRNIFPWVSNELITEKTLINTHSLFYIIKCAFISSLNLKYMLIVALLHFTLISVFYCLH